MANTGKSKRQIIRERQRRGKIGNRLLLFGVAAVAIYVIYLVVTGLAKDVSRESVGETIPQMPDIAHVEDGTVIEYSTDPPTSGPHYVNPMPAGFYNVGDILVPNPESHIVHSLEHGYVVFWYNCSQLDQAGCDELKDQIKAVIKEVGSKKVIAYPWISTDYPLVMTSWRQIQEFETFDADLAAEYVIANRSNARAPEANVD